MRPAAPTRLGATPRTPTAARAVAGSRVAAGSRPVVGARGGAMTRAAAGSRPAVVARPVAFGHGRALPRNAALVGRKTIAVAIDRPRTAAMGIATVAAVLLVVLFYLSQTFQAAAARYELDTLAAERDALLQELRSQDGVVTRWGSDLVVDQWAQDADLDRLGRRQRFEAR